MRHISLCLAALMLLASCRSGLPKAYFADMPRDLAQPIQTPPAGTLRPGDRLLIEVRSAQPEGAVPFNAETNRTIPGLTLTQAAAPTDATDAADPTYLVSPQGEILFPVLGRLRVEGITLDSLNSLIANRLRQEGYLLDAQVSSRLTNFRVAVLGEVAHPGPALAEGTRFTLLEALAQAGDITPYARPQDVRVIRQVDGQLTVGVVDMTSRELFSSPYYYLQQNDVVFVEPNRSKKRQYWQDEYYLTYIRMGVTMGSIASTTARTIYEFIR